MDLTTLIFNENFDEAKKFINNYKPDLNYVSNKGNTPLLVAIDTGNLDMVEFLLTHGSNPNFLDKRVNSPLIETIEIAVEENDYINHGMENPNIDIIKLLLKYGADINLKDNLGRTPLSFAKDYHIPAYNLFKETLSIKG